jgi:hypothetical protein
MEEYLLRIALPIFDQLHGAMQREDNIWNPSRSTAVLGLIESNNRASAQIMQGM